MSTTVYGQLSHRFHGNEHVARVYLMTSTEAGHQQVLAQLPKELPRSSSHDARGRPVAMLLVTSDQLEVLKAWLEPLRTDPPCTLFDCHPKHRRFGRTYGRHEIDSVAHSIDYGPDFELELPYVDLVTKPLPFDPIIHVRVGD